MFKRTSLALWVFRTSLFVLLFFYLQVEGSSQTYNDEEQDAYYKWFDMTRTTFDKDNLTRRYKKLAKQYHPDKNKDAKAPEIFQKIAKAFDVLNDDSKRQKYNRFGPKAVEDGAGGGGDASQFAHDIFKKMFDGFFDMEDLFGGGHGRGGGRGRGKGPTSQTELQVTLEDLYNGKSMSVEYSRTKLCNHCHGTGADDPNEVSVCSKCQGRGAYVAVHQIAPGFVQQVQMQCDKCSGRGNIVGHKCHLCDGQRMKKESEKIEVTIQPGTKDGEMFKFKEMADEHPDRDPGDLVVVLKTIEHSKFERDGIHLYTTIVLTLRQALLGFKMEISHLDGSTVELTRSEVTQNDLVERIKGAGMPRADNEKERGDLFVKYRIVFPVKFTNDQRLAMGKIFPDNASYHDEL